MWAASASATVALGVGLVTFFALQWMKKHQIQLAAGTWVTVAACIIALGLITPLVGGSTVSGFSSAVGRDATLTGRTEIWAGLLPDLMRQPFLGYGFSGFWNAQRSLEHQIGEAHNGYLDVCLQLGFIGFLVMTVFLLSCIGKAARRLRSDFDWGSLSLCFVMMMAIVNIAESAIDSFNRQMMAMVLLLSISVPTVVKRRLNLQQPVNLLTGNQRRWGYLEKKG
jgi:O-antigen ligase